MWLVFRYALAAVRAAVRERRELALENVALRHQVEVLTWSRRRPHLRPADRLLWVIAIPRVVELATPRGDRAARHRGALASDAWRRYWRWKSRSGKRGRLRIGPELAELIRRRRGKRVALQAAEHPVVDVELHLVRRARSPLFPSSPPAAR